MNKDDGAEEKFKEISAAYEVYYAFLNVLYVYKITQIYTLTIIFIIFLCVGLV